MTKSPRRQHKTDAARGGRAGKLDASRDRRANEARARSARRPAPRRRGG